MNEINKSNACSDGPGAIVKKITNGKSVDRLSKFCYTIIVKGKGASQRTIQNAWKRYCKKVRLKNNSQKSFKNPLTTSEKSDIL